MFEKFKEWLNLEIPKSARHYSSGFNSINKICLSNSLKKLDIWTLETWDKNYDLLTQINDYQKLNDSGKNILSATLKNYKLFLNSLKKIEITPKKPFDEFKWRWASKTPTESINKKEILFGVLKVLVLHNKKKHATEEFQNDMIELENSIDGLRMSLSRKHFKKVFAIGILKLLGLREN